MAVRAANPVITQTYSDLRTAPTNPFTQVNLEPNTESGAVSYSNAELIKTTEGVYHFAQQKVSRLMPLFTHEPMTALFQRTDTFNKVQWIRKEEETPRTPLYVPSGGTRSYAALFYHQGFLIGTTTGPQRRYAFKAKAQYELGNALGRLYDNGILWTILSASLTNTSNAAVAFQGVPTANVIEMPAKNKYLVSSSSGVAAKGIATADLDKINYILESRSLDPETCWIIGGPELRLSLKTHCAEIRDREKTISTMSPEQRIYFSYNGLNFCILGPKTYPQLAQAPLGNAKFGNGGGFPVSSGGSAATGVDALAIAIDFSCLQWGPAPFATLSRMSERDDLSYSPQFYAQVGFGGGRIDDDKVLLIYYKKENVKLS